MSKNLLQDMKKSPARSVPRITPAPAPRDKHNDQIARPIPASSVPTQGAGRSRYTLWLVAILSIVFFLFSISFLFLRVEVTVNPKTKDISLNDNFSASQGGNTTNGASGEGLTFDLVVISGEESKVLPTTGQKDVAEKARGVVVIYNNFSSASQRLDIDTRLEGSNGKIYKTEKQITVPGMNRSTPGSVEVGVYAAEAGPEYNSGPLDFAIFGFKGTPKYSKFYARSKDDISGGFKGKVAIISDEDRQNAMTELKAALQTKLFQRATDQLPAGFVLFKDAALLEINEDLTDLTSTLPPDDNMLPVKLKGILYGFLFNEDKLAKKIAEDKVADYDDSAVSLFNIRDLNFSLSNKNISPRDVKSINFNLKGETKIVWKIDESRLITDLLGKSKKDFQQILSGYPNIISADLVISPFWKSSFPDKANDIKVIVNYPK